MSSEKLFLFLLSCISNEIRINLETKPSWNTHELKENDPQIIYDILDTNLNIFDKLISYVISDDDKIDSWISTFESKTLHTIQQDIHNAIRALFFYVTELKHAVFEKKNCDINDKEKIDGNEKLSQIYDKFETLSLDDILNTNTLKLLDRILYGITLYLNHDLMTFIDEFCSILPFILGQFGDKYIGIISNVLSKMLTNKEVDNKYKNMIIDELYSNNNFILECLNNLGLKLSNGYKHEKSKLIKLENEFLSISLLIHDIFIFNENKFKSMLFDEENNGKFELLIEIICGVSYTKDKNEIILPLIVMILKIINQTSDRKLIKFVKMEC